MTQNGEGETVIDPVRMRNMTLSSQIFGTAHLTCDAYAYSAPGHALNPFYLTSKWKENSVADPSIPKTAPRVTEEEMNTFGTPSLDAFDTPRRASVHISESILTHSLGLIRNWAQWHGNITQSLEDQQSVIQKQEAFNSKWPHWHLPHTGESGSSAGDFLPRTFDIPANCRFPSLLRYLSDDDCQFNSMLDNQDDLVCLMNFAEEEAQKQGVCEM